MCVCVFSCVHNTICEFYRLNNNNNNKKLIINTIVKILSALELFLTTGLVIRKFRLNCKRFLRRINQTPFFRCFLSLQMFASVFFCFSFDFETFASFFLLDWQKLSSSVMLSFVLQVFTFGVCVWVWMCEWWTQTHCWALGEILLHLWKKIPPWCPSKMCVCLCVGSDSNWNN